MAATMVPATMVPAWSSTATRPTRCEAWASALAHSERLQRHARAGSNSSSLTGCEDAPVDVVDALGRRVAIATLLRAQSAQEDACRLRYRLSQPDGMRRGQDKVSARKDASRQSLRLAWPPDMHTHAGSMLTGSARQLGASA